MENKRQIHVLLVEDNMADVFIITKLFNEGGFPFRLSRVQDGEEAIDFLLRSHASQENGTPDIILLDLNIPKKDGMEVLREIKNSDNFRRIPVLVLTTSSYPADISRCYELHANSVMTKPSNLHEFSALIQSIETFWFNYAKLPSPLH